MTLIIGGSKSGKSAYAEEYIALLSEGKTKYYIATMQAFDVESQEKINRHRVLRKDKGFITIEQPISIWNAVKKMKTGEKTALLECMSNLIANEMFSGEELKTKEEVIEEVINGISALKKELTHFVIVSNNVFEDGKIYDSTTMEYMKAMGRINEELAVMADEVVEVVVGIPIVVKGKQNDLERKGN